LAHGLFRTFTHEFARNPHITEPSVTDLLTTDYAPVDQLIAKKKY
jgi:hypothetical protein